MSNHVPNTIEAYAVKLVFLHHPSDKVDAADLFKKATGHAFTDETDLDAAWPEVCTYCRQFILSQTLPVLGFSDDAKPILPIGITDELEHLLVVCPTKQGDVIYKAFCKDELVFSSMEDALDKSTELHIRRVVFPLLRK